MSTPVVCKRQDSADAVTRLHDPDFSLILLAVVEALTGALLLIGLGISILAIFICVLQLGTLPGAHGPIEPHLLLAAVGLCLALTRGDSKSLS